MELRRIANRLSSRVNPNKKVTLYRSLGYDVGKGQEQIPLYSHPVTGIAQIQALDNEDLKQLDGLNIQGTIRALYLSGVLAGVIRPDNKGGDKIEIDNQIWLVTKVIERWPDWTKVAIVLQTDTTLAK